MQFYAPPNWSWISITGPDARDFLHRLTTVHVNALQPGQGSSGFFLTAQGKIRAYFTLWNYGPQDYAFEFDPGQTGEWKTHLLTAIDQYTFAEKFVLTDAKELEARWLFPRPDLTPDLTKESELTSLGLGTPLKPGETCATDDEIRICHHGERDFGRPWISAWGRPARLAQWLERTAPQAEAVDFATLEGWRIAAARPRLGAEIDENTIPLEAGLIDGISSDKGCYPGQEVIERIISLGSPARRLVQLDGSGPTPAAGSTIFNLAEPPIEIGTLTSLHAEGGKFTALGYVRKIHAKEGLQVRFQNQVPGAPAATLRKVVPYAPQE